MKTAIFVGWSANNAELEFSATHNNHWKYCKLHNYTLIEDNEQYSPFLDWSKLSWLLQRYDRVMLIGSDCIFTDIGRGADEFFVPRKIGCCLEDWAQVTHSFWNGEVFTVQRSHDIDNILQQMSAIQDQMKKSIPKFSNKKARLETASTIHMFDADLRFGTQSVLNILSAKRHPLMNNFVPFTSGTLQSYLDADPLAREGGMKSFSKWRPGKYMLHLLAFPSRPSNGLHSKTQMIQAFFEEYPEYQ